MNFTNEPRNFIDGEWHRILHNGWTPTDPVNRIATWCGLRADDPPYFSPKDFFDRATPSCFVCDTGPAGLRGGWPYP
jgi:hypothetical protein